VNPGWPRFRRLGLTLGEGVAAGQPAPLPRFCRCRPHRALRPTPGRPGPGLRRRRRPPAPPLLCVPLVALRVLPAASVGINMEPRSVIALSASCENPENRNHRPSRLGHPRVRRPVPPPKASYNPIGHMPPANRGQLPSRTRPGTTGSTQARHSPALLMRFTWDGHGR